ncbi:hypothetical protein J6590_059823 [Homalodisca vitripennis]|nr:hypothetical protein J6590_059823 [Homalodisca vitripennis]
MSDTKTLSTVPNNKCSGVGTLGGERCGKEQQKHGIITENRDEKEKRFRAGERCAGCHIGATPTPSLDLPRERKRREVINNESAPPKKKSHKGLRSSRKKKLASLRRTAAPSARLRHWKCNSNGNENISTPCHEIISNKR